VALLCAGTVASAGAPGAEPTTAQEESARVSVPAFILFEVHDPRATTAAATGETTITFEDAVLAPGRALRLSVKADGDLTRSDGRAAPAGTISWRTSGASNGVGVNGTISKTGYTQVFRSNPSVRSGSISVTWSITLSGESLRAGTHQVALRWRVDTVVP